MLDFILLQCFKFMPTHLISRWIGKWASSPMSKIINPIFARIYQIPVDEAEKELKDFSSLNEFFTRKLRVEARPIIEDQSSIVSPADGKVAVFGEIKSGQLIQAKGVPFAVCDLLGISEEDAARYEGGQFITIYLSPRDYHRVHSPISGEITDYSYIPGTLFPVNAFGVRAVKGLFAMNERLITFISAPKLGRVAIVKVGATIVGSIKVGYSIDAGTNVKAGTLSHQPLAIPQTIEHGEELGYFQFGSTVVIVFEKGKMNFSADLKEGQPIKMGQTIGYTVFGL